jgi:hypothetical protein
MITALHQRAIALNTPLESSTTSRACRRATKVLGPMSFGAILGALALKLAVMPDSDVLARIRHRPAGTGCLWPRTAAPGANRFPLQCATGDLVSADFVVAVKEAEHRPLMRERFAEWSTSRTIGTFTTWRMPRRRKP